MASCDGMLICVSSPHVRRAELWSAFKHFHGQSDPDALITDRLANVSASASAGSADRNLRAFIRWRTACDLPHHARVGERLLRGAN